MLSGVGDDINTVRDSVDDWSDVEHAAVTAGSRQGRTDDRQRALSAP